MNSTNRLLSLTIRSSVWRHPLCPNVNSSQKAKGRLIRRRVEVTLNDFCEIQAFLVRLSSTSPKGKNSIIFCRDLFPNLLKPSTPQRSAVPTFSTRYQIRNWEDFLIKTKSKTETQIWFKTKPNPKPRLRFGSRQNQIQNRDSDLVLSKTKSKTETQIWF